MPLNVRDEHSIYAHFHEDSQNSAFKIQIRKSGDCNSHEGVTKDGVLEFYDLRFIALLLTDNNLTIESRCFVQIKHQTRHHN